MKVLDLEKVLDIEAQSSLTDRFLNNEELYKRFLRKLPDDQNFARLQEAAAVWDAKIIELTAHTLKGVCANLGLVKLSRDFAAIVNLVRMNGDMARLPALMQEAEEEMAKTIAAIRELD